MITVKNFAEDIDLIALSISELECRYSTAIIHHLPLYRQEKIFGRAGAAHSPFDLGAMGG